MNATDHLRPRRRTMNITEPRITTMNTKKRETLSNIRDAFTSESYDGFDEVCQMAIEKMMETTEWLHREFTDEEIKNAMRAIMAEKP